MNVPVYNMKGASVGEMSIDEAALSASYADDGLNPDLIKQAYVMYHANKRQGSARNKNRAAISGSTAKMYKQKGTGRARHSTKKAPQFKGGGRAFAKTATREDYHLDMPRKMRRKANRNALLAKLLDSEVRIIDSISIDTPKTKEVVSMLANLKIDKSAVLALSPDPERSGKTRLSARNVDGVTLVRSDQLTCFEMLNNRYLIIEKAELETWLTGASSQTDKAAKLEPMGKGNGEREARAARPKRGHAVKQAARAAKGKSTTKAEG